MSKDDPWGDNGWSDVIPIPKPIQQKPKAPPMRMERPPDSWNIATGPEGRNKQLPNTIRHQQQTPRVVNSFPNERVGICTECNTPAINVKECPSMDSICRYRHCWHYCLVHKNRVRGRFRPVTLESSYCTCNVNPVQFNLPKHTSKSTSGDMEYFDISGGGII
jgi:hypothetical protein